MHVHVVVVNVTVGFVAAHGINSTVLTNEVLASSHRSSNKRSVVVELVDVVELREDFWRQCSGRNPFIGGFGLLSCWLVLVNVGGEPLPEIVCNLCFLLRRFLGVKCPIVLFGGIGRSQTKQVGINCWELFFSHGHLFLFFLSGNEVVRSKQIFRLEI